MIKMFSKNTVICSLHGINLTAYQQIIKHTGTCTCSLNIFKVNYHEIEMYHAILRYTYIIISNKHDCAHEKRSVW